MKLDLDFMNQILVKMENHDKAQIMLQELLPALGLSQQQNSDLDRLRGHLKIIRDANFITSSQNDLGIIVSKITPDSYTINSGVRYELTLQGHQMLELMRNDNWLSKIKNYLKEQGATALQKVPGFLIGIAVKSIG